MLPRIDQDQVNAMRCDSILQEVTKQLGRRLVRMVCLPVSDDGCKVSLTKACQVEVPRRVLFDLETYAHALSIYHQFVLANVFKTTFSQQ